MDLGSRGFSLNLRLMKTMTELASGHEKIRHRPSAKGLRSARRLRQASDVQYYSVAL